MATSIITQVNKDGEYVSNSSYNSSGSVVIHERSSTSRLLSRLKRLKNCMCCCMGKDPGPPMEAVAIENHSAQNQPPLLDSLKESDKGKKCVVIDLDETLVHSSFKPVPNADFVIPVDLDGTIHQVYVLKRPYVDDFLAYLANKFECVLFTASLAKYADPVSDLLDVHGCFSARLFREACIYHRGNYVKMSHVQGFCPWLLHRFVRKPAHQNKGVITWLYQNKGVIYMAHLEEEFFFKTTAINPSFYIS